MFQSSPIFIIIGWIFGFHFCRMHNLQLLLSDRCGELPWMYTLYSMNTLEYIHNQVECIVIFETVLCSSWRVSVVRLAINQFSLPPLTPFCFSEPKLRCPKTTQKVRNHNKNSHNYNNATRWFQNQKPRKPKWYPSVTFEEKKLMKPDEEEVEEEAKERIKVAFEI